VSERVKTFGAGENKMERDGNSEGDRIKGGMEEGGRVRRTKRENYAHGKGREREWKRIWFEKQRGTDILE